MCYDTARLRRRYVFNGGLRDTTREAIAYLPYSALSVNSVK